MPTESVANFSLKGLLACVFYLLTIKDTTGRRSLEEDESHCRGIRSRRHALISTPPAISGVWLSPACEMLPGPQYVMRQYEFTDTGRFNILRFYYSDEKCALPAYAIRAEGVVRPESRSWLLSEATDMDVQLQGVFIKPYTHNMSTILKNVLKFSCGLVADWSSPPFSQVAMDTHDSYCLDSLMFSADELLVMRQVDYGSSRDSPDASVHRTARSSHLHSERELQLGNVFFSQLRRPSSYQTPLYSLTHRHCTACSCLYNSNVDNPPTACGEQADSLPDVAAFNLTGTWYSDTCESLPNALFTLRSLWVDNSNKKFQQSTRYFQDPFCSQPSFELNARGQLEMFQKHPQLLNAYSFRLSQYEDVTVRIQSEYMRKLMNLGDAHNCGNIKMWTIGEERSLLSTRGCDSLGITLRDEDFVLVKLEQSQQLKYLTVSELRESENEFYSKITHFSARLKRCVQKPDNWSHHDTPTKMEDYSRSPKKRIEILVIFAALFGMQIFQ